MEKHGWEGRADKLFEHPWLLADEGLMDQSRMNTLIDRDFSDSNGGISADSLGVELRVSTTDGGTLLMPLLQAGSLVLEFPRALVSRA